MAHNTVGPANMHESTLTEEAIHVVTKFSLLWVEILRWITIIVPLYLATWRFGEIRGYPEYTTTVFPSLSEEDTFLAISGIGLLAASVVVYLPAKIVIARYKWKNKLFSDHRWRPSILVYILICALPSLVMILFALQDPYVKEGEDEPQTMDTLTITVLQLVVFGLVITEWICKCREEYFSYDLVTVMAVDFFFAFDIISFFMMSTLNPAMFTSDWLYVDFVFTFIAMFKYMTNTPPTIDRKGAARGTMIAILVSMIVNDIPFFIIRCATLIIFDGRASDIIFPLKNGAMIVFGIIQIWTIKKNLKSHAKTGEIVVRVTRKSKFPNAWDEVDGSPDLMKTLTHADEVAQEVDKRNSAWMGDGVLPTSSSADGETELESLPPDSTENIQERSHAKSEKPK